MESLSHMYVLPYHILSHLLREERQGAHPAAPPNAKADGGALMQVKSYATLPPGKAASMRRPVMMYPARPRPPGLTLLFLSHHLIEPSERKADDIVIGAFYTRNQDRALALDAVRAGFIHRFTGGDVAIDLRSR